VKAMGYADANVGASARRGPASGVTSLDEVFVVAFDLIIRGYVFLVALNAPGAA